jgi:hypothetical protein
VRLATVVLNDTGNEIKDVAVIVCGWIRDIENVEAGDLLGGGSLKGIDSRRRFNYVDDFVNFLDVEELDFDGGYATCLEGQIRHSVKARFFNRDAIRGGSQIFDDTATGEVGRAP